MQVVLYLVLALLVLIGGALGLLYRPDLDPAELERGYGTGASRFVEVAGVRFHYRAEGDGPPLVLLHGLSANLFVFEEWATILKDRFRVIRLDLPGHGLTGPDPQERYRWSEVAELIVKFLDQLGIEHAILAGNSLGGAIAWQIAARHPDRVESLVLIAPVGYTGEGRAPWILRLLGHPVTGPAFARLIPQREFVKRVRGTFADPERVDPERAIRQYRLFRRAGNRDALSAVIAGGAQLETEPLLARIEVPTLVLWGSEDPVLPPRMAERFARDIEGACVAVVADAGHTPMLERPVASADLLLEFLEPPRSPDEGKSGRLADRACPSRPRV